MNSAGGCSACWTSPRTARTVYSLHEPFYKHFLVSFPPWEAVFPLEMVPCAIAICYIAKGDARQAIIGAANVGRDADTIAAIAGELMGVLYGAQAFPQAWLEQVLRCNPAPDLPQMARDLCEVMGRWPSAGRSRPPRSSWRPSRRPG